MKTQVVAVVFITNFKKNERTQLHHSLNVWLLGWSSCSSPYTIELHKHAHWCGGQARGKGKNCVVSYFCLVIASILSKAFKILWWMFGRFVPDANFSFVGPSWLDLFDDLGSKKICLTTVSDNDQSAKIRNSLQIRSWRRSSGRIEKWKQKLAFENLMTPYI